MTYQTSPYMKWIFPDEAYHLNTKGITPLRPVPLKNGFDLFEGGGSEARTIFDSHDRKVALDRVRYNKKKEEGMLGHLNTTVRSQRYDRSASRSAVPNGVFPGNDYVTSAGLRGGVIYTKDGQEWLAKRLKQRAEEYSALSSGDFSKGPPSHIDVSPYNDVDTLLQILFTAFTSGTFSNSVNDNLNKLLQALIKIGTVINPSQLTEYAQAIGKMTETTRSFIGDQFAEVQGFAFEGREKRFRNLDAINATLKVIDAAIKEIARVIYEPQAARKLVMDQLSSRLLGRQVAQFRPGFISPERQERIEAVGPPALGPRPGPPSDLLNLQPEAIRPEDGEEEEEDVEWRQFAAPAPRAPAPPPADLYGDLPEIGARAGLGRRRKPRRSNK